MQPTTPAQQKSTLSPVPDPPTVETVEAEKTWQGHEFSIPRHFFNIVRNPVDVVYICYLPGLRHAKRCGLCEGTLSSRGAPAAEKPACAGYLLR